VMSCWQLCFKYILSMFWMWIFIYTFNCILKHNKWLCIWPKWPSNSIVDFTTKYNIYIKMRDYKHNHRRSWRCSDLCYPFYYDMKIFGHLNPKNNLYILIWIWSFILIMLVSLFWKLCQCFISMITLFMK